MKKITIINGHPDSNSLNHTLAQNYQNAIQHLGGTIRYIPIGALDFNPNLMYGYKKRMELEPDLIQAIENIK